jgi:hypothetical protein
MLARVSATIAPACSMTMRDALGSAMAGRG